MGVVHVCDLASPQRDALEEALTGGGHRVVSFGDIAALFATRPDAAPPDCVVLDESAAGGLSALYAATTRLRAERTVPRPLGVFAIIVRPEPDARANALKLVDDVLSRPAHLVEVVARVEALVRRHAPTQPTERRVIDEVVTGLRTRAFLDERIPEEWRRASRFTEPLSLLLVGLEGDSARPPLVDRSLRDVATALRRSLRQIDVLGRFSSTELAALLVNTHLAGAITCAERLKRELGPQSPVEIAMGLALYPGKDVTSGQELVRVGEKALHGARHEGAGSICVIQHQSYMVQSR